MATTDLGVQGSAQNKVSGTTLTITNTTGATIPAGRLLVLGLVCDNPASTTQPTLTFSTNNTGGTWSTPVAKGQGVTTTAGSGIWTYGAYVVTGTTIAAGATICTITFSAAVVAKAAVIEGYSNIGAFKGSATAGTSATTPTTAAFTFGGTTPAVGDLVVAIFGQELATYVADTSTTGGTWDTATPLATSGSTAQTNVVVGIQDKDTTGSGATGAAGYVMTSVAGDQAAVALCFTRVNAAPVAAAGSDQSVVTGATVNLSGAGSTDDLGITAYSWTPVLTGTSVSDDFTRANTAGAGLSGSWVNTSATAAQRLQITSNQVTGGTAAAFARHSTATVSDDQWAQCTYLGQTLNGPMVAVPGFASGTGVSAISGQFYHLRVSAAGPLELKIRDVGAASFTTLYTDTVNVAVNDVIRVEYVAGVIYAYLNGVFRFSYADPAPITGNKYVGIGNNAGASSGLAIMDTFAGGDYSASPLITLTNSTTATPSFTAPQVPGVYTIRLTVTDAGGLQSTDDVQITVTAPVSTSFEGWGIPMGSGGGAPAPPVITLRASAPANANVASKTSAAFTPAANSRLYVWSYANSSAAHTQTVSGGGLTWVQDVAPGPFGAFSSRGYLWHADIGASPASMQVTITAVTNNAAITYAIFDIAGGSMVSGQMIGSVNAAANPTTVTTGTLPAAPVSGHLVVCCAGANRDSATAIAIPSGFTSLVQLSGGGNYNLVTVSYSTTFTAQSTSWSNATDNEDYATALFEFA